MFDKIKNWYQELPNKKRYVEFLTALLTVPVLLTVLIINLSSINNRKETPTPTPTPFSVPTEKIVVITQEVTPETSITPTVQPSATECKKEVGPVKITAPADGELITTNPVCLNISYQTGEYCSVVWSYRIGSSAWSDFTDKEICIYNLPVGPQELQVRVKSSQSDDEVTLIRNFYYQSKEVPTPTPTLTLTPTPTL
jgi:hypothetical protein